MAGCFLAGAVDWTGVDGLPSSGKLLPIDSPEELLLTTTSHPQPGLGQAQPLTNDPGTCLP